MRGVSSVLDVTLFLLLVGVAVLTLTVPVEELPARDDDAADGTADLLATSTATVEYSLTPGAERADDDLVAFPTTDGDGFRRTAHDTLAGHLAAATVGTLAVDGERPTDFRLDYRRAVEDETRTVTRGRDSLARIRVVWEPYPDAPVRGETTVGPRPPVDADVHAATLTVDSGLPSAQDDARRAAEAGGYEAVARAVAERTVAGLFPPDATRDALLGAYPTDRIVEYRYRRFGLLLGTDASLSGPNDVEETNGELTAALTERLERDMARRFDSPEDAAAAVRVGEVRITVRTWSP